MKLSLYVILISLLCSNFTVAQNARLPLHAVQQPVNTYNKSSSPIPLKSRIYSWNDTSTAWDHKYNREFTYNSNDVLLYSIGKDPSTGQNTNKIEQVLDSMGVFTGTIYYTWDGSAWQVQNGSRKINTYNSSAQLVKSAAESWNGFNQAWQPSVEYSYTYNQQGETATKVAKLFTNNQWVKKDSIVYSYQNGLVTKEMEYAWDGTQWSDNALFSYTYNGGERTEILGQLWDGSQWINNYRYINMDWHTSNEEVKNYILQEWSNNTWINEEKYDAVYDTLGGYASEKAMWAGNWFVDSKSEARFDAAGNRTLFKGEDYSQTKRKFIVSYWFETAYTYSGDTLLETISKNWNSIDEELRYTTREVFYDFKVTTAIADEKKGEVSMYPNPATDQITLQTTNEYVRAVKVYDSNGREVLSIDNTSAAMLDIDVSAIEAGVYILQVTGQSKKYILKFIKR